MKDAKNHMKHIQKKVVKSAKKNRQITPKASARIVEIRRPKTILNKRKVA